MVQSLLQQESSLAQSLELIYSLVSVSVWPQINNWSDLTAGTSGLIHENAGDIVLGCTNSQSSSLEISPKRLKKPCSCSEPGNAQREEGADQFEKTETRL